MSKPLPVARGRDRGQATPLWAIVLVLAGLLLIPTARLIRVAHERAEARSAADAAALAGALADPGSGRVEAASIATANDAVLVDYSEDANTVTVTVRVGGVQANARAEREIIRTPSTEVPRRSPIPPPPKSLAPPIREGP